MEEDGLEDTLRSSVSGGNIGKPLMLALLALLASGALFRGGGAGQPAPMVRNRHPTKGLVACSEVWVGCWTSSRRVVWAMSPIPGSVRAKISRSSPGQLGSALGPDVIKTLAQRSGLSEELPSSCRRFCPVLSTS